MKLVRRGELVRFMIQEFVDDWMASAMITCATIKFTHSIFGSLSFVSRSSFFRFFFLSFFFLSFCLRISNECRTQNETKRIVSLAAQCLCRLQWLTNNESRLCATCCHQFYSKTRNDRAILWHNEFEYTSISRWARCIHKLQEKYERNLIIKTVNRV